MTQRIGGKMAEVNDVTPTWSASSPHVRRALKWLRTRKSVTAEELIDWDRTHGGHLFFGRWSEQQAAHEWYLHQARVFLNSFRGIFEGKRVRAYIHINEDEAEGIAESGYVHVRDIAANRSMREQVIADISRRMRMLASELAMWKLSAKEQKALFAQLEEAMTPTTAKAAS